MITAAGRAITVAKTLKRFGVYELIKRDIPIPARLLFALAGRTDQAWLDRPRGERLKAALEALGPIFIKFGQLLSTRPDLLPADIAKQLKFLQDQVTPYPSELFLKRVSSSLGQPLDELFASVDTDPLASASVAQVHRATLKSGEGVVIKCLRPDLGDVIDKDIALLRRAARLAQKYVKEARRLKPMEVVEEYKLTIDRELDLRIEAANASQFKRNAARKGILYLPTIYWDFCTKDVMVSEFIDAIPVTDIEQLRAQQTNLKLLAERGVEIFFTQVFDDNFFHADMHPGNIFVSRSNPQSPTYMAVDCAIAGSLTRDDQYYLARNLLAIFRRDYRQVAELHIDSGWVPKTTRIGDFELAIRSVCEPIFEKPLGEISFARVLINLFQTARQFDMQVQPQLVLLQKTMLNIEGLGRQLYPELDLWATAHPYLEKWLKQRFHPKSLWGELARYGPDWLEKFPQVPNLIFDALSEAGYHHQPPKPAISNVKNTNLRFLLAAGLGTLIGLTSPYVDAQWLIAAGALACGWFLAILVRH